MISEGHHGAVKVTEQLGEPHAKGDWKVSETKRPIRTDTSERHRVSLVNAMGVGLTSSSHTLSQCFEVV